MRVKHLEKQSSDTSDHHAHDIGMDHADGCVLLEQRFVRHAARLCFRIALVEGGSDRADYALAKKFEGVGATHAAQYRLGLAEINAYVA